MPVSLRSTAILAVALLAVCSSGVGGRDAAADPLDSSLRVEPDPVTRGDSIRIALQVTNRADTVVTLEFTTAQRFDAAIRRDGSEVSRWSTERMFTQVLGAETYSPDEARTLGADMVAPGEPGNYTLVGWVTSETVELRDSVEITVR